MAHAVVLTVAPSVTAGPYGPFYDDVVAFLSRLMQSRHPDDAFLVVIDPSTHEKIGARFPEGSVLEGSIPDIWIRDFAPVRTMAGSFKFRYLPGYLDRKVAQAIERGFMDWFCSVGLESEPVDLVLDGGNFVYNGVDSAVVTERVLEDNLTWSRREIRQELQGRLGLETLAIIPEGPRDKTGHADGMVVWLAADVLGVARYREPERSKVLRALGEYLPGVEVVELPFQPTGELWEGWESAAGVYVNALSTENALYVPRFGLEADEAAIQAYCARSSRDVIPVTTGREVRLGGSVHCLTWDISGDDARRMLESRTRSASQP
jgi:agmatine/peptidylarginine deiminase